MNKFERVNADDGTLQTVERLKVCGGWLVVTTVEFQQVSTGHFDIRREDQYAITSVFLPDMDHQWIV